MKPTIPPLPRSRLPPLAPMVEEKKLMSLKRDERPEKPVPIETPEFTMARETFWLPAKKYALAFPVEVELHDPFCVLDALTDSPKMLNS